ncbi:MAG: MOSC domain-containing protein [Candidatus Latescibacteria bacterium]|nr:MOSC domain-containing protein [bacterium]MCB9514006.1 MOSC domain-containing protein [Candidatus Latescibacterota bacterium]MCB9515766.1 MOSC domain-containing protein [Candidatus Latescibacterota bacterium]
MRTMNTLGRVVGLWRYPIKSMAAEPLQEVELSWQGLAGDRRWAFVRGGMEKSNFPWLTIRQLPELWHYRPRFLEPGKPESSATHVHTPDGRELDVTDPALAAELGHDARVIRQNRGAFDVFPVSVISTQTVASLGAALGTNLDVLRFRPNLLIEATGDAAHPEDDWVGATLRIGDAEIRVDKRDGRCVVITVDPATGAPDPAILRAVAQTREGCLGVYGSTVRPGRVALGDAVVLG